MERFVHLIKQKLAAKASPDEEDELQLLIEKDESLKTIYTSLLSVPDSITQLPTLATNQAYLKHLERLKQEGYLET